MQFVHVILAGRVLGGLRASFAMLVMLSVPTVSWMLVRVCVMQLVLPLKTTVSLLLHETKRATHSLRQTTLRTVG
jgi:hypothetical protein